MGRFKIPWRTAFSGVSRTEAMVWFQARLKMGVLA